MPSGAYQALEEGLAEVAHLLRADPTPRGKLSADVGLTRAVTRACVVILCSHFERYLRAVNEEAVGLVNQSGVQGQSLPEGLRLQHSRVGIRRLAATEWTKRGAGLRDFAWSDAWLWCIAEKGQLDHASVLDWMKSPMPRNVRRLYQLWGVDDIFRSITRRTNTRRQLFLKMRELVEKRNNIAHGDIATEATANEIREYQATVAVFCERADRLLGRKLGGPLGVGCPWY
jgi:hypothetical protein